MPVVTTFIEKLKNYESPESIFNPWRDYDKKLDISPDAPSIRSKNLERFLRDRLCTAKYLFLAEALGYQGGHFSGIPMTSERIILGNYKTISESNVFASGIGQRTSNPKANLGNKARQQTGFTERTATIVWKLIQEKKIPPFEVVLWNAFPFHPFKKEGELLTNRSFSDPSAISHEEKEAGKMYLKQLMDLFPNLSVIAIGKLSERMLTELKVSHKHVPHPAHRQTQQFREKMKQLFP